MLQIVVIVLIGCTFLLVCSLYFRSIKERNHLCIYAGTLLLVDRVREDHKGKLDNWIRSNAQTDATALSSHALNAISRMAESLAKGNPATGQGSLVLGFRSFIWDRQRELQAD